MSANPGGIAGAMDYKPSTLPKPMTCIVCGAYELRRTKFLRRGNAKAGGGVCAACDRALAICKPTGE